METATDQRIDDPSLAEAMAYAEQPHRDEIAERQKDVAVVKEAADLAVRNYVDNVGDVTPAELEAKSLRHTMLRGATGRANARSLQVANEASEAVRQQYEGPREAGH